MMQLLRVGGFLPYILVIFLNALVDLGHKIIIQNTIFKSYDGELQIILTAVVNALILLPFILVFTPAGFLSDKYPKNRVMRYSAWFALLITGGITFCYHQGLFWPGFAMTFLLAIQSAFYSPAKYGYIKELTGNSQLTLANGVIQATTTIAILAGTLLFSILFEMHLAGSSIVGQDAILQTIAPLGWLLMIGASMELLFAYLLPQKLETDRSLTFDWKQYRQGQYLHHNLRTVYNNQIIWLSIIGLAIFWALAQAVLASFPAFAKTEIGLTNTAVIQGMMACAGIGVMLGSLIAGKLSRNHIETGLIPIGALGVASTLLMLPGLDNVYAHALNFMFLGLLGGLFIIPLNALIQFHAGKHELGRVLAANNLVQTLVMLLFLGLTITFSILGISTFGLLILLSVVAFSGAAYTLYKLPQSLIRFLLGGMFSLRYRLDIIGFNNIPERGGVLMLGNHISWIDWAIIQIASPRPVRFVMERAIYERWYLKWFLDFFGVIPIASGASKTALATISELLNNGEVVCLFPEGAISRNGQLGEFRHGYEKAAASANGVILPFYLRGLWGSRFSRASEKLKALRRSSVRRNIIVSFGAPLPMSTTADILKRHVFTLSVTSWQQHTQSLPTLPVAMLQTAKQKGKAVAAADSIGKPLSYHQLLTGALCFSRLIKRESPERNIGLLLPTTTAGAIANMAALLRGKTVVNLNYTAGCDAVTTAIKKAEIRSVYTSRRFLKKLTQKGVDTESMLNGIRVLYMEDLNAQLTTGTKLRTLILAKLLPIWLLQIVYCKRIDLNSTAAILFSSGSEGEPKGIMLSHRNIMTNLRQVSDVLNTQSDDVIMATLPLFHAFGLTVTTFMPLVEGIPMICHPDPTDVFNAAKAIARYRATILCGTSTFLRLYSKNRRIHPVMLESLRIVVAGAERLSPDVREAFKLKFNKDIYEGYGATETTPVASVNIPDRLDPRDWKAQVGNKPGTVGMPLPGTAFRIVDPKTLTELPAGSDGLILIGGAQVMLGYLNDQKMTDEVIVEIDGERWYKTGDKGHIDKDGFLTIVDRYSRFAKLGGEMISLTAVEEEIYEIINDPALELVAVNVPDSKKGEKIVLLTNQKITLENIKKALLDAGMNPLMIPATVFDIENIPKLGSGKTDFKTSKRLALEMCLPEAVAS